jgi:5,6-dimethylbenzimidazole synthase
MLGFAAMKAFGEQYQQRSAREPEQESDTPSQRRGPREPVPDFDGAFRAKLYDLLRWRRDVRRFKRDTLPKGLIERLLGLACLAPSVGLSEPWRFVLVEDPTRRAAVRANFETCNAEALSMQSPDRAALYARLKLQGMDEAPVQIAVYADRETVQGYGLGRMTMPETIDYSVVTAVHTFWLAARAEGIGVGWVSIIDPAGVTAALDVPQDWIFIGYLCVGYPQAEDDTPTLQRAGWEHRHGTDDVILRR